MTNRFDYGAIAGAVEVQQFGALLAQCFNSPPSENDPYFQRLGLENIRVIRQAGRLVGGLGLIPMAQWWGGQRVPMTGIAAVGIAPEYRGSGAAIALMQHTLRELHTAGVAISVLYPAAQQLYRKVGYEQGGSFGSYEVSPAKIQIKDRRLAIHPVSLDSAMFLPLQQQQAQLNPGHLDRHAMIWQFILHEDKRESLFAYCFGEIDQPQGYIIFTQGQVALSALEQLDPGAILRIKDWVILTPEAGQTFWTFLADHRAQIDKVRWKAGAIDPLTLLLPEQTTRCRSVERWMLRVIDVSQALETRGYPAHLQTELHLEIHDDLLPENSGRVILSIAAGQGQVTKGGKGEVKLDIRGLAPLYTGLFTPHQLQVAGKLETTSDALLTATQVFASSSPWMPDFF
jgi:predicted acetyltransferase